MNEISVSFWKIIPGFFNIQYPWRFLSVVVFSASFLASGVFYSLRSKLLFFFFIFLVLYANRNHLRPVDPFRHEDHFI